MNFQQNWLKVLECVETLINQYIWLFATSFQLFCEIKCDILEKKSINNHFKQPCERPRQRIHLLVSFGKA